MLKEKISEDLKNAMLASDADTVSVLRMIIAAIKNKEVELRVKQKEVSDEDVAQILNTEAKKRRDAVELYKKGGRKDLADKEAAEIEIVKKYLPEQLSEKEIEKIINKYVKGATNKEFGPAMKELMKELKGKADASLISKLLKEKLG